jgi:membrane associated rhomboid family serine protease
MTGAADSRFRWPYSAAATFVGLMWIGYAWSIWAAQGIEADSQLLEIGRLTRVGYYIAGDLNTAAVLQDHEWERAVSAIFLHFGFFHIFMNSAAILQMGRILEAFTSRGRCWFTLLVSGLLGSLATVLWAKITGVPTSSVGASGAGCGLGTAMVVLSRGVEPLAEFRKQMITWVIVMLGLGLLPMISGTGHAGGAIGGVVAGLIVGRRGFMRMKVDRYAKLIDVLALVLTLLYAGALVYNASRVPERRLGIANETALREAEDDVRRWRREGVPADVDAWVSRMNAMQLDGVEAERRDYWVDQVDRMRGGSPRAPETR